MSEKALVQSSQYDGGALLLSTGLTVAALILVPAMASRLGMGAALTGAMRMALMRASSRAVSNGKGEECGDVGGFSCH
ncbi:MAG: hypothetical protein ACPW60_14400 [Methylohalobius sp. ZOD2]|uniref:hypothetical protein n=1 Tax=Methylohalobius crimeensis TaxID=244365 RepID=UPI0003B570B5|nr:hypothetical protein [Methylohalobius crimeensis]MBN2700151.1 hypothetical protein [Methylothermaceae bacterium]